MLTTDSTEIKSGYIPVSRQNLILSYALLVYSQEYLRTALNIHSCAYVINNICLKLKVITNTTGSWCMV